MGKSPSSISAEAIMYLRWRSRILRTTPLASLSCFMGSLRFNRMAAMSMALAISVHMARAQLFFVFSALGELSARSKKEKPYSAS